jgi:hypothetical protein
MPLTWRDLCNTVRQTRRHPCVLISQSGSKGQSMTDPKPADEAAKASLTSPKNDRTEPHHQGLGLTAHTLSASNTL